MIPPKPEARPGSVSLLRLARLFRRDLLSALPQKLYRARMAEFRTPFFRSFLCNDPPLIRRVLEERPDDFPKSDRIREGLAPLLGNSVFVTNGEVWKRQRRIIDPAFAGGRLREVFPAMWSACEAAVARQAVGTVEMEALTSHAAADMIFRTLFSLPIEDEVAQEVFHRFRDYQRAQPIANIGALVALPRWMPRFHSRRTRAAARDIRRLIGDLTRRRAALIAAGQAPDDLATKIMTTPDPLTGALFSAEEMVDQVAIFFLAGHETSASAAAWALYLLATHPEAQERIAEEAADLKPDFAALRRLPFTRDVFREALRLYPPVPMMVRENLRDEDLRGRAVSPGAQIVLSPWHLHRHERLWERPDAFDPDRWKTEAGKASARDGYMPFSSGPRVCTGAGFAMMEGVLLLAHLVRHFRFLPGDEVPVPVAHLTVRAAGGIPLRVERRQPRA
ncbi:cytochrome P450 [Falsirhodobacter algicola]|uniref:Cytochrome P450 n=1 Tax=Falsirhodobacter algicola TaxID=2692330 RepID=A0A8J8MSY8_9RHOB|nr:cytochrome P450 [Falsirhodobacter algicola]QUS35841.1 cytochrome P450 [Falsirhodobacter algicola]